MSRGGVSAYPTVQASETTVASGRWTSSRSAKAPKAWSHGFVPGTLPLMLTQLGGEVLVETLAGVTIGTRIPAFKRPSARQTPATAAAAAARRSSGRNSRSLRKSAPEAAAAAGAAAEAADATAAVAAATDMSRFGLRHTRFGLRHLPLRFGLRPLPFFSKAACSALKSALKKLGHNT